MKMGNPATLGSRKRGLQLSAPAGGGVLILDQFTAADSTDINGRTPAPINVPGNNWAVIGGTAAWAVQGNQAAASGGGVENWLAVDSGIADATVSADITVIASGEVQGISLRIADSTHHWLLYWTSGNVVYLVERDVGATVRASGALVLTGGTTHEFKAVLLGTTITGYVDGVQILTYGSATSGQTNTKHGLYAGTISTVRWDNFKVTP